MEAIICNREKLKQFAVTFAFVLFIIGAIALAREKESHVWYYTASLLFALAGYIAPAFLKPLYGAWMRLALVLGWINSRLLLLIVFYLIITPIGLVLKVAGFDLLERAMQKDSDTYWKKKVADPFNPKDYERQF